MPLTGTRRADADSDLFAILISSFDFRIDSVSSLLISLAIRRPSRRFLICGLQMARRCHAASAKGELQARPTLLLSIEIGHYFMIGKYLL